MKFDFLSQAAKFLQERKEYKRWLAAFMCLALAVTFGTVGALKMYGQAMTHQVKVLECQYEVHEHTEDCYEKNEDGEPIGDPVCGYADYVIHVHNDDCYDENQNLVCPLEEIEKHEHDDDCYEKKEVLVCEENESENVDGHTHTEACYTEVKGELICEVSDDGGHTHDDGCYSETLVCDQEEHRHDDSCYKKELVCDNEEEDHEHDDGCYDETLDCDKDEHEHGGDCYSKELTCTEEEGSGHEHTDDCYKTEKELTCEEGESESADGHTHDDECYETEEVLTCGKLELHTHKEALVEDGGCYNESAFDEDGEFIEGSRPVCGIPQLEEHVHTAECFKTVELTGEEVAQLNAGGRLHVHEDSCYDENGNLICEIPSVHVHGLDCYDEDGNLICGSGWAHTHDESCYDADGNLICGQEETHVHNKDCYDENGNLICGEQEEEHEHDANCYDADGRLTCGYEDAKDHEHDANCYDKDGNLICGYEGVKDHEHSADCYDIKGNLICSYEGVEDHVHSEVCYDADGNLICGYEILAVYENSKIFECEDYVVVARYNEDAHIPAGAELLAEKITPETDEEHYARREAEYQETLGDETASMRALLKIGFYLDGEEDGGKTEIEPETPVEISIQFLDEDGLPEGSPITVVHFADEGTEKLDGSKAKNSSTTFEMKSFSEIAIGYGPKEDPKVTKNGTVHISDSFEYEDDAFHITFFVEGEAAPVEGETLLSTETDAKKEIEINTDGDEKIIPSENETETKVSEEEKMDDSDTKIEESDSETQKLEFKVEPLDEKSEKYKAFTSYAEDMDELDELLRMQLLSYSATFDGVELDLSECEVTAEVTTTEKLQGYMEESLPEAVSYLANNEVVVGVSGNSVVEDDVQIPLSDDEEVIAEESENVTETEEIVSENDYEEEEEKTEATEPNDVNGAGVQTADEKEETVLENNDENEVGNAPVSDDTGILVYGDAETDVKDDIEIEDNTEILVSIAELSEDDKVNEVETMTLSEETKHETMSFSLQRNVFALRSTAPGDANPVFKVEYYANLKKVVRSGGTGTQLQVINTSNGSTSTENKGEGKGALPQNGKGLTNSPNGKTLQNIFLNSSGVVQTKTTQTKVYATKTYEYKKAPSLMYFDCLVENAGYKVVGVWVKYATDPSIGGEGFKPSGISPDANGWYKYTYDVANPTLHFTNRRLTAAQEKNYVFINKGATIRLVYDPVEKKTNSFDAKFYDYNIANGKSGNAWNTVQKGINDSDNYKDSGAKYAFGNANCSTGLSDVKWGANYINRYNRTSQGGNDSYQGCAFGLVNGIEGDDTNGYNVIFSKGINGLKIFGGNSLKGKDIYDKGKLNFSRSGDTYTLTAANSKADGTGSISNLDKLPKVYDNGAKQIYSNSFWPMDGAKKATDPQFGKSGENVYHSPGQNNGLFPGSDDGKLHNSFFGMHYTVKFNLDKDYVGPLEYLFFGDDDMWVFLDGKLICDLGGVHSSVGEYVNLWDWLTPNDKGKEHTLHFFYTERGASGSSCWMQFTLPSVTSIPLEQNTGTLQVSKSVLDSESKVELITDDEFLFSIKFTSNSNAELRDDYCYTKYAKHKHANQCYDANNKLTCGKKEGDYEAVNSDIILFSGSDFTLKNGEYIVIKYLPIGAKYEITEKDDRGYYYPEYLIEKEVGNKTTNIQKLTSGGVVNGSIGEKGVEYKVKYNNLRKTYQLPETGGFGSNTYTIAGVLAIMLGAGFLYKKKFRERRA